MKYQAVIFDLDGTLLNTLQDLAASVNAALSACGFPERSYSEIRSFVGNGVTKLMERSVPKGIDKKHFETCFSLFRTCYMEHMYDTTAPYEGILPLLAAMKQQGYHMAIVSNKLDTAVKELNKKFFSEWISTAIGTPAEAKKPNPFCVFQAAKEMNLPLASCLYAGDSDVDILTARHANIPCIGVSWGFRGRAHLEQHGADYIVDTPEEFLQLLETLANTQTV